MQQLPTSERPLIKSSKILKIFCIQVEHVNCNAVYAQEICIRDNRHLQCCLQISIQSTPEYCDNDKRKLHKEKPLTIQGYFLLYYYIH